MFDKKIQEVNVVQINVLYNIGKLLKYKYIKSCCIPDFDIMNKNLWWKESCVSNFERSLSPREKEKMTQLPRKKGFEKFDLWLVFIVINFLLITLN
jgi:hypothetical protein